MAYEMNDLESAATRGDTEGLALALLSGSCVANEKITALGLRMAATYGRTECVRMLIPFSNPKAMQSEALQNAAYGGHLECLRLLIPVSDVSAKDGWALTSAAIKGHVECVKALMLETDPEFVMDALLHAATNGQVECVRMLMKDASPDEALRKLRNNPRMVQGVGLLESLLSEERLRSKFSGRGESRSSSPV